MESVLPLFFFCGGWLLWSGLMFALGRYTATRRIRIERIDPTERQAEQSPYYKQFAEEV